MALCRVFFFPLVLFYFPHPLLVYHPYPIVYHFFFSSCMCSFPSCLSCFSFSCLVEKKQSPPSAIRLLDVCVCVCLLRFRQGRLCVGVRNVDTHTCTLARTNACADLVSFNHSFEFLLFLADLFLSLFFFFRFNLTLFKIFVCCVFLFLFVVFFFLLLHFVVNEINHIFPGTQILFLMLPSSPSHTLASWSEQTRPEVHRRTATKSCGSPRTGEWVGELFG